MKATARRVESWKYRESWLRETLIDFAKWVGHAKSDVTPETASRYARYAEQFCKRFGDPRTATVLAIGQWRQEIEQLPSGRAASKATVNVKIVAIRAFFAFLKATGHRRDDPTTGVLVMQRIPERLPQPLDRSMLQQLFDHALYGADRVVNPELLQDRAIFETLYGSGLRRTEAATLRLENILDRSRLRVIGKRDKERITMITESQYLALRDWVLATLGDAHSRELEETVSKDAAFDELKRRLPKAALFYTVHGKPLESLADPGRFIWERCRAHFNRLKATGGRPHRFRHSFFTDLLDGGCDLDTAAELGGHASVNTTRGYRALTERGIALARRAHPRG